MKIKKRDRLTAYHEAGHAVVAYFLHRRVTGVTIIRDKDTMGLCRLGKIPDIPLDWDSSHRVRMQLERDAMIDLAGNIAEYIFRGKSGKRRYRKSSKPNTDILHTIDCLLYLSGDGEETGWYVNWLWHRTRLMLQLPCNWAPVQAVATELLEHRRIGEKHLREIIRQAIVNYIKDNKSKLDMRKMFVKDE